MYDSVFVGSRIFELSNHLGNVLSTISDKKVGHDSSGVVDYYTAEVLSQQDYYPFGMQMPGRGFVAGSSYRYGFNGKETDNEVKGVGAQYDYGFRIYDPRLGKFLSVDPLSKQFPMLSTYQYASNSPIANIDLDGGEAKYYSIEFFETYNGKGQLLHSTSRSTEEKSKEAGWYMRGIIPWHRGAGILGDGTLYTLTSTKTFLKEGNTQQIIVQNVGAIYIPPPPQPSIERPISTMPFNIAIFGSSSNPEWGLGSKANPNAKTINFNYAAFQTLLEPILIGQPDKIPGSLKTPNSHDFLEWAGGAGLDKAIEKLKADWEGKPGEGQRYIANSEICPSCELPAASKSHKFSKRNITYLTNERGEVSDTLKPNKQTGKKDTIPTKTKRN